MNAQAVLGPRCPPMPEDTYLNGADHKMRAPVHDKIYNKTCDQQNSDQPVHSRSTARVLVYPSLDNLKAEEGTCDQRRL